MRHALLVPIVLAALALAGCADTGFIPGLQGSGPEPGAQAPQPEPLPILQTYTGDDPAMTLRSVRIIDNAGDIQELHAQTLVGLRVDLTQRDMVLLALGEQPSGGYAAQITSVKQLGDTLYVQGRAITPNTESMTTQQVTYPYCVAVIPETNALRVQSNIQTMTQRAAEGAPTVVPADMGVSDQAPGDAEGSGDTGDTGDTNDADDAAGS